MWLSVFHYVYVKYDFCENNFFKVPTRFDFPFTIMTVLETVETFGVIFELIVIKKKYIGQSLKI